MDSFTENMMNRAQQRRKILEEKMADMTRKKKRSMEDSEMENMAPETILEDINDDSPHKRHCIRGEEQSHKPDTPAMIGVKSRLHGLTSQREEWASSDGFKEAAVQQVQKSSTDTLSSASPNPKSRRNRLAALASNINNWEDDLSHPVITKTPEKPKKVWQPPRCTDVPEAPPLVASNGKGQAPATPDAKGPAKPPRLYEETVTIEVVKTVSKPLEVEKRDTHTRENMNAEQREVSTLNVNIGGAAFSRSPVKTSKSPVKSVSKSSPQKKYAVPPAPVQSPVKYSPVKYSPVKAAAPATRSPVKKYEPTVSRLDQLKKKETGRPSIGDPAAQPVLARMGLWQQRVDTVQKEQDAIAATSVSGRQNEGAVKVASAASTPVVTNGPEPTQQPVHSRMAAWETKVQQDEETKKGIQQGSVVSATKHTPAHASRPAVRTVQKSPVKTSSTSPTKGSPRKVAPATQGIHSKLTQLQASWKDNEISEKTKKEREAEMAALSNRWTSSGKKDEKETHVPESQASVPLAPPPPPPLASSTPNMPSPILSAPPKPPSSHTPSTSKTPTAKRIEARDRLRTDFESKLSAMGFEVNGGPTATLDLTPQRQKDKANKQQANSTQKSTLNVQVSEQRHTTVNFGDDQVSKVPCAVSINTVPGSATPVQMRTPSVSRTPGGSLYRLIKNQGPATPSHLANTDVASRAKPAPAGGRLSRDSFDSDDSFPEQDSEPQSQPSYHPPAPVQPKLPVQPQPPVHVVVETRVQRKLQPEMDSSETEDTQDEDYSETEYTETEVTTQSEDDYESEDASDEYESEADETGGAGDLLAEAMDSTTVGELDDAPVAAPRSRQQAAPYRQEQPPQAQPPQAPSSRPPAYPPTQKTMQLHVPEERQVKFRSPVKQANSTSSDTGKRMVHSINAYRNSQSHQKTPVASPRVTVVRRSEHLLHEKPEESLPYIPEKPVKQRLQELQDMVTQEQTIIMQTSNALNQCCGTNSAFAGSSEAVECHRLLLQACRKREVYMSEMQRLRDGKVPVRRGPQGSLTVSDIRLPLKRDFMSCIGTANDNTMHYFLVLLRHDTHLIFTQLVSTHDALVRGCLDFPNMIKLSDIRQDFRLDIEVYGMSVIREIATPKKKKGMTPKKPKKGPPMQSPGGPLAVRSTNFVNVASLTVNMNSLEKTHFNLERVPFSSPLQGTVHIRLRCVMESHVEEHGFLTMFEDVSGLGSWHRRWCALKNNFLSFWKYPDDEKIKEPIGFVDLKACITGEVGLVPRDICARPNTFEIHSVRRQQRGENDTLVSRCYNTMTTTKHWISADTKEDRIAWCNKLNDALRNIRAWNADAMRPLTKPKAAPRAPETGC